RRALRPGRSVGPRLVGAAQLGGEERLRDGAMGAGSGLGADGAGIHPARRGDPARRHRRGSDGARDRGPGLPLALLTGRGPAPILTRHGRERVVTRTRALALVLALAAVPHALEAKTALF